MSKWINIKNGLPEAGIPVKLLLKNGEEVIDFLREDEGKNVFQHYKTEYWKELDEKIPDYVAKVYSGNTFVGCVTGKHMSSLEREANKICDEYDNNTDSMVVYIADGKKIKDIRLTRTNKTLANLEIERGNWA